MKKDKYSALSLLHKYNKLVKERDNLKEDVTKLAFYNYSRERDFYRDRTKLRETINDVAKLKSNVEIRSDKLLSNILKKVNIKLKEGSEEKTLPEESESLAKKYLHGEIKLNHEEFLDKYIKLRKEEQKAILIEERIKKDFSRQLTDSNNNNKNDNNNNNDKSINYNTTTTNNNNKRVSFA